MRTPRLLTAALLVVALAATSCVHKGSTAADHHDVPEGPPSLALVPSDTPYAIVSLKPLDPALQQKMLERGAAMFSSVGTETETTLLGSDTPALRVYGAWLAEMRGHMDAKGLTDLGMLPSARILVYGVSLYPVVRWEIADPVKLHDMILRILARAKVEAPEQHAGAQAYWQIDFDGHSVAIAIVGKELVAGLVPSHLLADFLPYLFGTSKPARSLAAAGTLRQIALAHGLDGSAVGFVDLAAVSGLLLGEVKGPLPVPMHEGQSALSPACVKDVHRLIGYAPRFVIGTEKLTATELQVAISLETIPAISGALAALSHPIAGLELLPPGPPLATIGVGVNVGDAIATLRRGAQAITAAPFGCPELADLNQAATDLEHKLATPLPGAVLGLSGAVVTLDDLDLNAQPVKFAGGALLVGSSAADLLRQGLALIAPGQKLNDDGKPMAVSLKGHGIPGVEEAYVAARGDKAAAALGPRASAQVVSLLGAAAPAHAPLFVLGMDLGRLMKLVPTMADEGNKVTAAFAQYYGFATYAIDADREHGITLRVFMQMK
jgi:hypothetical protein